MTIKTLRKLASNQDGLSSSTKF